MDNNILIENEMNELYREYKRTKEKVDTLKNSYVDLSTKVDHLSKLLEKETERLKQTVAEISDAKLKWSIEKAEEMKVIEEGRQEIEGIKKARIDLESRERKVSEEKETIVEKIRENNTILLSMQSQQTVNNSILRQIEEEKANVLKERDKNSVRKEEFKAQVTKLLKEFNG